MKKSVLVTLADKGYIDQAKQLFSSVYWHGQWTGDYLLLAYDIPQDELEWFHMRGIQVMEFEPIKGLYLQRWPSTITGKFYLFTAYFRQWETVVFLDADIIVRDSIAGLADTRTFAAVIDLGAMHLGEHFSTRGSFILEDLKKSYDLDAPAFNSGVFAFNTNLITEDSFAELTRLSEKYSFITLFFDQCILNLYFHTAWEHLSLTYNLQIETIKKLLNTKDKVLDGSVMHFVGIYKPWHGGQYLDAEWKKNLLDAESMDVRRVVSVSKRSFSLQRFLFLRTLLLLIRFHWWVLRIKEKVTVDDDMGEALRWLRQASGKSPIKNSRWKSIVANVLWDAQQKYQHIRRVFLLRKIDTYGVPEIQSEIRLFMSVRNEYAKLPYLFDHYRRLGVDRFFVIDNGSTDGTRAFLLSQKDTHVWTTTESFKKAKFGSKWFEILLKKYGTDHWCLIADADEVFVYPDYEHVTLHQLAYFLEQEGSTALESILLEMYADKPIYLANHTEGGDLLQEFPFFDAQAYHIAHTTMSSYYSQHYHTTVFGGGMRERVFGTLCWLNKISFFKHTPDSPLHFGQHFIRNATLSGVRGAVLHFKYDASFIPKIQKEVVREEHWQNAVEYKSYTKKIVEDPAICPYYEGSVRFENSSQLVQLGIMKTSEEFESFIGTLD